MPEPHQLPISSLLIKLLVQACGASCYALQTWTSIVGNPTTTYFLASSSSIPSHPQLNSPPTAVVDDVRGAERLVEADGLAHGGLDVERLDVLPVLLEQGDEEVDAEHDVSEDLVVVHVDVADGNTQAENLLELELDSRLDIRQLSGKIFVMRNWGWEFASLG